MLCGSRKAPPRFGDRCILVTAELPLDGRQPVLTLPQLGLGQAVGVLGAQRVTQLLQGLQVLLRFHQAAVCCDTRLAQNESGGLENRLHSNDVKHIVGQ